MGDSRRAARLTLVIVLTAAVLTFLAAGAGSSLFAASGPQAGPGQAAAPGPKKTRPPRPTATPRVTVSPTQVPTVAPTILPTKPPTQPPTQPPTLPPTAPPTIAPTAPPPAVLVGAGDIASCSSTGDEATAAVLGTVGGTVFTLGDNVYDNGTFAEYTSCYGPTWGVPDIFNRTMPVPGNHEYNTPNATGYFQYFGAKAGDPAKGYYAHDLGAWRVYALNSNCAAIGGCSAGSAEETWLRNDLAANPRACVAAMWHHPLFSSGFEHGNNPITQPLWQALYDANADIILTGHDHDYERFAPQTATGTLDNARGIVEFVVGTGGRSHYGVGTIKANSLVRNFDTYGILRLSLTSSGYSFLFIHEAGKTFTDSGSGSCH